MNRHLVLVPAAVLLLSLLLSAAVLSQTSPSYNLEWHVVGGGGQPVSSAHFRVNGTIGQGAASPPVSTSARYAISGGYWWGGLGLYETYLPIVLKSP